MPIWVMMELMEKKAKAVIDNLKIIVNFLEKKFDIKIYEKNT